MTDGRNGGGRKSREIEPCPTCGLPNGFHDHGEPGSRHDALMVARRLTRPGNKALRREARAKRSVAARDPEAVS